MYAAPLLFYIGCNGMIETDVTPDPALELMKGGIFAPADAFGFQHTQAVCSSPLSSQFSRLDIDGTTPHGCVTLMCAWHENTP